MSPLPLPLSPLDPVVARRRSTAVAVLTGVACVGVAFLEVKWLHPARDRAGLGEPLSRALGATVTFGTAAVAAGVLFALAEVLRIAVAAARAGGAAGLATVPSPSRTARVGLLLLASWTLVPVLSDEAGLLSVAAGAATYAWIRAMGSGPGVGLLCAPSVSVTAAHGPAIPAVDGLLAVGLVGLTAVAQTACVRRFPRASCLSGAAIVATALALTARAQLLRVPWDRATHGASALVAILFVGTAYGVRLRRARR